MHRFIRLLRAEVASGRTQVPVEQVPVDRRPRVVEHPLNHARRRVLVATVRLEHGTLALVRHELRGLRVVLRTRRRTEARGQRRIEAVEQMRELSAGSVKQPHAVEWPRDVLLGHHAANALDRRNGGARTRLGVVAPATAMRRVLQPIRRRYPIVRPRHLHAALPGELRRLRARR